MSISWANQIEGSFECLHGGGATFRINFEYINGEGIAGPMAGDRV